MQNNRSVRKLVVFAIFFAFVFLQYIKAQEIEAYIKQGFCNHVSQNFCAILECLSQSLNILDKIQQNNAIFLIEKSEVTYNHYISDINHNALKKDEIVLVSADEYKLLKKSLRKFCKHFKYLRDHEKTLLFSFKWNGKPIFYKKEDVVRFCKLQY